MVVCRLVAYRAAKALAQLSDVIGGVHLRWDIIERENQVRMCIPT